MADWTKALERILPRSDGEDVLRLRKATVTTVDGDGTIDVLLSGVSLTNVPTLEGSVHVVGDQTQLLVFRGGLLAIGPASVGDDRAARGIMTNPTRSTSDGTATAADAVEVRDAVLGNYVFTAATGRLYRVVYNGNYNSTTGDVRAVTRIRDGGVSTPTTASTLIAETTMHMAEGGTGGRQTMVLTQTFTASAGAHTLSMFTISPESVVLTPINAGVGRELYVEDIGPVF